MTGYTKLDAWQKSMALVKEVYELTNSFPKEELYALTPQIKRAVVSVPCNIAEGSGRNYKKEPVNFCISQEVLYMKQKPK